MPDTTCRCSGCNAELDEDNPPSLSTGGSADDHYCSECTCTCELCDEVTVSDDTSSASIQRSNGTVDEVAVCESCDSRHTRSCDWCGDNYVSSRASHHPYRQTLCPSCSENAYSCDACGDVISEDDTRSTDNGTYCESCYNSRRRDTSEVVSSYGDRISTRPWVKGGQRQIGIELEMETKDCVSEDAESVVGLLPDADTYGPYAILKEDSSLDDGFELVTRPSLLEHHKKALESFFKERPSTLVSADSRRCGLHVHMNAKYLSRLQIGKVRGFINERENQAFLDFICGRRQNSYCGRQEGVKLSQSAKKNYDRYVAVNETSFGTIEFRCFKGTLNPATFWARVEFACALVEYCGIASIGKCVNFLCFTEWMRGNTKAYPALHAKLVEWMNRKSENRPTRGQNSDSDLDGSDD